MGVIEGGRVLVTGRHRTDRFGRYRIPGSRQTRCSRWPVRLARVSKRAELVGAQPIIADVRAIGPDDIPANLDYVVHAGAATRGKLGAVSDSDVRNQRAGDGTPDAARGRCVKGFVYSAPARCSPTRASDQLQEDDPFGLHNGIETYSASKIAASPSSSSSHGSTASRQRSSGSSPSMDLPVSSITSRVGPSSNAACRLQCMRAAPTALADYVDDAQIEDGGRRDARVHPAPGNLVNFVRIDHSYRSTRELAAGLPRHGHLIQESDSAYLPGLADVRGCAPRSAVPA